MHFSFPPKGESYLFTSYHTCDKKSIFKLQSLEVWALELGGKNEQEAGPSIDNLTIVTSKEVAAFILT